MEFAGAVSSGQTVDFLAPPVSIGPINLSSTLKLDQAQSFNGTIEGLAAASSSVFDAVDLANFNFNTTKITDVTGSGKAGTLTEVTLTDSSDNLHVTLQLLNQFTNQFAVNANDYSLTSDGASPHAGTIFSVDHALGVANHGVGH